MKTIVLTGAGSGGHITPLLAVASVLKHQSPDTKLIYIGQKGDKLGDIPASDPNIDEVYSVRAGKFRRYHGEGLKQLLDFKTFLLNLRDALFVGLGLLQSRKLLKRLQPDVIFIKGGFVGVPVGLAAARLGIPYVTHDSDAIPGLANRIIAKWAQTHAVALPEEIYKYPRNRTVTTGIPLQSEFEPVTEAKQRKYREEIGIPEKAKLLFIIGGGLGSRNVNNAVGEALPHLLEEWPDLYIVHGVGRDHEAVVGQRYVSTLKPGQLKRVRVFGFLKDVYRYSGAADIVITRAGATNLAEFALQGKACIVIPSPFLTGGHQLKNAAYLAQQGAAKIISEQELADSPNRLAQTVSELLKDPEQRASMGESLSRFAYPNATRDIAKLLLETAGS